MDVNVLYQEFLNLNKEAKTEIANECVSNIMKKLEEYYGQTAAFHTLTEMFSVFGCVDGVILEEHHELFMATTKVKCTYENYCEAMFRGDNEDVVNDLFEEIEDEDADFLQDVCMLALCIFTVNNYLSSKAKEFIEKHFIKKNN